MPGILNDKVKLQRVHDGAVAATTDITDATGFDLSADGGYDGVLFIALFGALSASQVTSMRAQQSSDDGDADAYTDIANSSGTVMADDDDEQCLVMDVYRPEEKWVKPVIDRATGNAVLDGIMAVGYRNRTEPTTHDSSTISSSNVVAEQVAGTA